MAAGLLLVALPLVAPPASAAQDGPQRPNVILVMTDDQGWGDASFRGHSRLKTPQLDAMAANGARFERFYAAAPVCSPTRGSVLTGRHPARFLIEGANSGHLPREEVTLAELLRERGYATGHFGKWHLGTLTRDVLDSNRGGRPERQQHYSPPWEHGFDVCFSTEAKVPTWDPMLAPGTQEPYGTAYWNERGERVESNLEGDDSRVILDRVLPFVRRAAEAQRPFFAVVWLHAPHEPVVAGAQYLARYSEVEDEKERSYLACLSAVDDQIGRLRAALRELGVADDTLLWFCSDNGPEHDEGPGSTGGLRGRKRSLHEGGVRVPGILEWPRGVPEPVVVERLATTSDYLPTIADLLDVDLSELDRPFDGESLLPVISGATTGPRTAFFRTGKQRAVHRGTWKLSSVDEGESWALFDLAGDPSEGHDRAAQHPQLVAELSAQYVAWEASVRRSRKGLDYGS